MPKIEQWSEQLALAGRSWVVRHEAEAKIRALEAENAELLRQVNEEHDTDETLLAALITATLCRLPAEVVGDGEWDRYRDAHGKEWLGQHRAFGGWLAGRITAALERERGLVASDPRRVFP